MELNLISIKDLKTGRITYHAVNDKHYDGILATGGSNFDLSYEWKYLGDISITEEILNEEKWFKFDPHYKECLF